MFQYNQYESKKRKNDYGETSKSEKKVCIYLHPHNASKYHARKNKFGHIQRVVTELVINIAFRLTVNFYLTFCHLSFFHAAKLRLSKSKWNMFLLPSVSSFALFRMQSYKLFPKRPNFQLLFCFASNGLRLSTNSWESGAISRTSSSVTSDMLL